MEKDKVMAIKAKNAEAVATVESAAAASPTAASPTAASPTAASPTAVTKWIDATVPTQTGDMTEAAPGIETTPTKITQGLEKAMKNAEDFVAFGQGNVDAYMKASQIWATGMQNLSKQFAATAQASFNDTMATFKALSAIKSVKDAVELQTSFARSTIEKTVAESGKLTDASMKLTEQALAPIAARVTMAVESFSKAA